MYVPRGYENYFRRKSFTPSPITDNIMLARPAWGGTVYAAGQPIQTTTVGDVASAAAVPIALLGFVGLIAGGWVAYSFVRRKWGR